MNMNSGYVGYSMSVRASEAYDRGEMPLSKWNKSNILEAINEAIEYEEIEIKFNLEMLEKLTVSELKRKILTCSSWHHTGKYCKETDFYSVDTYALEEITNADIEDVINSREPKERKPKQPKAPNLFVTALVEFDNWEGTRKHPVKRHYKEVVQYMSKDKLIWTQVGNKRLSSLSIIKKIEQKTKYADKGRLNVNEK